MSGFALCQLLNKAVDIQSRAASREIVKSRLVVRQKSGNIFYARLA